MEDLIHRQRFPMRLRRHARMARILPEQYADHHREPLKREVRHSRVSVDADIIRLVNSNILMFPHHIKYVGTILDYVRS